MSENIQDKIKELNRRYVDKYKELADVACDRDRLASDIQSLRHNCHLDNMDEENVSEIRRTMIRDRELQQRRSYLLDGLDRIDGEYCRLHHIDS